MELVERARSHKMSNSDRLYFLEAMMSDNVKDLYR